MNRLSGFKYCIPLTNSKRVLWKYFYYIKISFSLVSERLRYCNFIHSITLQVVTIQKFLVIVFDTEIGRLCAFNLTGHSDFLILFIRTQYRLSMNGF